VPIDQLSVFDPSLAAPLTAASLPRHASLAANGALAGAPYQLALSLDPQFPIIHVEATAPDRAHALRIVSAAASIIERDSSSLENKNVQGMSFVPVDQIRVRIIAGGGGRLMAVGVALMLFGTWLSCIALASIMLDRRRAAGPRKISVAGHVDLV
jgi:hypothetical protein